MDKCSDRTFSRGRMQAGAEGGKEPRREGAEASAGGVAWSTAGRRSWSQMVSSRKAICIATANLFLLRLRLRRVAGAAVVTRLRPGDGREGGFVAVWSH